VVAIAAATLVAGCGGKDKPEEQKAIEPLLAYYDAIADGDAKKACEQTAGEFAKRCLRLSAAPIRDTEGRKLLAQNAHTIFDDRKAVIRGDLACVAVDSHSFDFVKTGGDWKVLRLNRPLAQGKRDCTVGLKR
jgi:hypothetical protein